MSDVRSKPHVDQDQMPEQLSSRHLRRRLVQLAVLVVAVALVVWLTPGLGPLRKRLDHASAPWLVVAGGLGGVRGAAFAAWRAGGRLT